MRLHAQRYVNWIKIATLLILVGISLVFLVTIGLRRSAGLPTSVLIYLLVTGFCFMLVEIAMIAVLSAFLLTSGIGSWVFPRIAHRLRIVVPALVVAGLIVVSIYLMDYVNARLLGLPLWGKLPIAFALMAPVGLSLGWFYPYAVSCWWRTTARGPLRSPTASARSPASSARPTP